MSTHTSTVLRESSVNATEGHMIGEDSQPIEDTIFADVDNLRGELYHFGLREYGRCIGKVYVDAEDGVRHVGYVFQSRRKYEDCDETYLHETWLSVERVTRTADIREGVAL